MGLTPSADALLERAEAAEAERDALRDRLTEAEKDAARYGWLRDVAPCSVRKRIVDTPRDSLLDAAIDAALAAKEGNHD
jgi:hypothetical protein